MRNSPAIAIAPGSLEIIVGFRLQVLASWTYEVRINAQKKNFPQCGQCLLQVKQKAALIVIIFPLFVSY